MNTIEKIKQRISKTNDPEKVDRLKKKLEILQKNKTVLK